MPLLSFVVPTLDRQDKVIRAVSSILSQNFKGDLEVIVVDDGSSPPITLPSKLASDPRARIVRKERTAGPGAARNTGLTLAGGEWAGFLDSDDYLLPDTLNQRFADAVEDQRRRNNPLVLYTCGWAEVSQGGGDPAHAASARSGELGRLCRRVLVLRRFHAVVPASPGASGGRAAG